MKKRMIIVGLATVAVAAPVNGMTTTDCTVRLRVVDEAGRPVTNAYVRGMSDWAGARQNGLTDTNGVFAYRDRVYSEVGCTVTKEGYYRSQGDVWHWNGAGTYPTNTLTVMLKRIMDPVPMVYRKVTAVFPRLDEPVGFDLEAGDWVAPDGKGKVVDMTLTATRRFASWNDYEFHVRIGFPGENDGIREFEAPDPSLLDMASDLVPPQRAPESGYGKEAGAWISCLAGGRVAQSRKEGRNYMIRVRTALDEEGRVEFAHVGWILGDFGTSPTDKTHGQCYFRYYWNPDPRSRSLEPKEIADRQGR